MKTKQETQVIEMTKDLYTIAKDSSGKDSTADLKFADLLKAIQEIELSKTKN